jgi:hypothetical protein
MTLNCVNFNNIFARVLDSWSANDEFVDFAFIDELVFGRWENFVLSEVPSWFAVWFCELSFKDNLLVLAFLGKLIDQWSREGILFLNDEY